MTISTSECALTITFTDEEHGEPCNLWDRVGGCTRQAVWRLLHDTPCGHIPSHLVACQPHRDAQEEWMFLGSGGVDCLTCGGPSRINGWEPIGGKK